MSNLYAVFGNPVGHSKSPLIHSEFARQTGQDLEYVAIEAPLDGVAACVNAFRARGGKGANVTAPFKLEAFSLATRRSSRAEQAEAANALKFEGDEIVAENFDGVGLVRDIQHNLGFSLRGRQVLMLGAGGAARGATVPILQAEPAQLTIVNRTIPKADVLRERFSSVGNIASGGYALISDGFAHYGPGQFDIIINATSASLRGELPPITNALFRGVERAYELAYGQGLTPFLRLAKESGVDRLTDGVGMLVEQAAEAFEWWHGVRPATCPMIKKITVPLA
jgi:shikimate dehydrogenase